MQLNFKPKQSLGQNFLIDKNIAGKIVNLIQVSKDDLIVEIGPGRGVLTQFFCDKPASFVIVEIDSRSVDLLRQNLAQCTKIEIVHGDFLSFDINSLNLQKRRLKWIGNLPYNITSSVLFKMLSVHPLVQKAVFMVQVEVAQRIVSTSGSKLYGILSVLMQTFYDVKLVFKVSKHVFRPKPKVDSAVISLDIRPEVTLNCDMLFFQKLVKTAFNQRRKQLRNSLRSYFDREEIESVPFDLSRRAEDLTVEEWKKLCRFLEKKKKLI